MDPIWQNASDNLRYEFEHRALPGFLFGPSSEEMIKLICEEGVDACLEYCWKTLAEHFGEKTEGFPLWQIQSPREGLWFIYLPEPVMEIDVICIALWIPQVASLDQVPRVQTLECFDLDAPKLGLHCEWFKDKRTNYGPKGMSQEVFEIVIQERLGTEA